MATIKTRFGTLNLGSGGGSGVPLALQSKTIDDTSFQKDTLILTNLDLNPNNSTDEENQKLTPKGVSLIDMVKTITDNPTEGYIPSVNSVQLDNTQQILKLNSVDLSALPQLAQQDGWLILDSEKALINDKPQSFTDTDKSGMNNIETK